MKMYSRLSSAAAAIGALRAKLVSKLGKPLLSKINAEVQTHQNQHLQTSHNIPTLYYACIARESYGHKLNL